MVNVGRETHRVGYRSGPLGFLGILLLGEIGEERVEGAGKRRFCLE